MGVWGCTREVEELGAVVHLRPEPLRATREREREGERERDREREREGEGEGKGERVGERDTEVSGLAWVEEAPCPRGGVVGLGGWSEKVKTASAGIKRLRLEVSDVRTSHHSTRHASLLKRDL